MRLPDRGRAGVVSGRSSTERSTTVPQVVHLVNGWRRFCQAHRSAQLPRPSDGCHSDTGTGIQIGPCWTRGRTTMGRTVNGLTFGTLILGILTFGTLMRTVLIGLGRAANMARNASRVWCLAA